MAGEARFTGGANMTDRTTPQDPATRRSGVAAGEQSGMGGSAAATGSRSHDAERPEERARRAAEDIKSAAKEAAASTAGAVRNRVSGELDYRKYRSRQRLSRVANALRETGSSLHGDDVMIARYTERAADRVEQFAAYLDQKDMSQIMVDARRMARQRPELFVGSLFVAGLMLGRFLRTAQPRGDGSSTGRSGYPGQNPLAGAGYPGAYSPGSSYPSSSPSTSPYGSNAPTTPSGGLVP
jgi:hypothetical protein